MNLKKLKRLLSLTLSAAMVASMISVPVNAETVTDSPASALEETVDGLMDENAVIGGEEAADEVEDPEVVDETEEEEGVAEAFAEELHSANETDDAEPMPLAEDDAAGGNGGEGTTDPSDPSGSEDPAATVIEVGTGEGKMGLKEALIEASKPGAETKNIVLTENVTLDDEEGVLGDLEGVKIETDGYMITIPEKASVTLNNLAVNNERMAKKVGNSWSSGESNHMVLYVEEGGNLTINGGEYTTKGVQLLKVAGKVTVDGEPTFKCEANVTQADSNFYDGATLIDVEGILAKLEMRSGTVSAEIGNGTDCGMYAIYIWKGGEVVLGTEDDDDELKVTSHFPAIAMNGTTSPGRITVNGGTYESSVVCEEKKYENFNSVMYLPATANVTINGGVFKATGDFSNQEDLSHVISIPYEKVNGSSVRLNLKITGGTFKSSGTGDVFYKGTNNIPTEKMKIAITGGSFSSDPTEWLDNENYAAYDRDGMHEVSTKSVATVGSMGYETLKKAIDAAKAGTEKTITLNANAELESDSYDLDGITIKTEGYMIKIAEGANVTLTNATIKNDTVATGTGQTAEERKVMLAVLEGGELTLNAGTYETKGNELLSVKGKVTVTGAAKFSCTVDSDISGVGYYDGTPLIGVSGAKAELIMKDEAQVSANIGNNTNCGMYGIFVGNGGKVELGKIEDGKSSGPSINSMFSAVAMNYTIAPGTIIINGGTYTSNVACTDAGERKFNAAIYLPAKANVTIKGGTFTANRGTAATSVISVPYAAGVNLAIEGGTFKVEKSAAGDALFHDPGENEGNSIIIRGGVFGLDPDGYVAECHGTSENTPSEGMWTVSSETNEKHTFKWVSRKDPTCWEEGVIGHYECSNCHKMYQTKNEDSDELSIEDVVMPKKEHAGAGIEVQEKPATCTEGGHKAYFMCDNCKLCYDSMDELNKDTTGSGNQASHYDTPPVGHDYSYLETADEANNAFDWTKFSIEEFEAGKDNGVTATRSCSKNCGHSETTTSVTVELKEDSKLEGNCTENRTVDFVATAVFENNKYGESVTDGSGMTISGEHSVDIKATPHEYDVTFDWSNFDPCKFVENESNDVTASGKCKVCGGQGNATVAVTCNDYPTTGELTCENGAMEFEAVATFDSDLENEELQATYYETEKFSAPHKLDEYHKYEAPTCTSEGRWGYYTCSACGNSYYGEDEATKPLDLEKDIVIEKRPHSFAPKSYKWVDEGSNEAQVTFQCTACEQAEITFTGAEEGVEVKAVSSDPADATCGKAITTTYKVSVPFDKGAVKEDGTYDLNEAKAPVTYSGTLTKKTIKLHEFDEEKTEVKWVDGEGTEGIHDVNQGVKATLVCENCEEQMVVTNKDGIIDDETTIEDTSVYVAVNTKLVLGQDKDGTDKTYAATCKKEGKATYQVRVYYDNSDGKGMRELTSPEISTKTKVDPDAHNWTDIEWTNWTAVPGTDPGTTKMVNISVPNANGDEGTYQIPCYKITGSRKCSNIGCEETQEATGEAMGEVDENKPYLEIKVSHSPKTCVKNGRTTYDAIFHVGEEVVGKASPQYVYNESAEGHRFKIDWDWKLKNEKEPSEGYDSVIVTRSCEKECGEFTPVFYRVEFTEDYFVETETENGIEKKVYVSKDTKGDFHDPNDKSDSEDGKGLKVKISGKQANCDDGGEANYDATVKFNSENIVTDEKEIKSGPLGHNVQWFLEWSEAGKDTEERNDDYTLKAVKACARDDCPGWNGSTDEKVIKVKYMETPATCVEKGEHKWIPDPDDSNWMSIQSDTTCEFDETHKKNKTEQTEEILVDKTAHNYGNPTIEWEVTQSTKTETEGKTIVTAILKRKCTVEGCTDPEDEARVEATMKEENSNGELQVDNSCTEETMLEYFIPVDSPELKEWKDVDFSSIGLNTEKTAIEAVVRIPKDRHHMKRIAAQTGSCTTPGWPTYYHCSKCGKDYRNSDADVEVEVSKTDPLGHIYGGSEDSVEFTWTREGVAAEARFECTRKGCSESEEGHYKTMVADIGSVFEEKQPECEGTGITGLYYYSVSVTIKENAEGKFPAGFSEAKTYAGDLEMIIPVGGHQFGENGSCIFDGCTAKKEVNVEVQFIGRGGNVIETVFYDRSDEDFSLTLPTVPNQVGYQFKGWAFSQENDAETFGTSEIAAKVKEKVEASKGEPVKVYAIYSESQATARVKVVKMFDGNPEDEAKIEFETVNTGDYTAKAEGTVTGSDGETYTFSHWQQGSNILGTELTYTIRLQNKDEITLYAAYVNKNEQQTAKPTITMTGISTDIIDGVKKLSFTSNMNLPSDYELVENGMLYSAKPMADKDMVVGATGVGKGTFGSLANNTMTVKIAEGNEERELYVKGYLRYMDKDGTTIITIYTELYKTTYNRASGTENRYDIVN